MLSLAPGASRAEPSIIIAYTALNKFPVRCSPPHACSGDSDLQAGLEVAAVIGHLVVNPEGACMALIRPQYFMRLI